MRKHEQDTDNAGLSPADQEDIADLPATDKLFQCHPERAMPLSGYREKKKTTANP